MRATVLFLSSYRSGTGLLGDKKVMLNANWPSSPFSHLPGGLKIHHLRMQHFSQPIFLHRCTSTLVVIWHRRDLKDIPADYREGVQMENLTHTQHLLPHLVPFSSEQIQKNGENPLRMLLKLFAMQPWSRHFV